MIDKDENLTTLAKLFNVTTAFVSAVLIGKKSIPETWCAILSAHYNLDEEKQKALFDAYCEDKKSIKFDVENLDFTRKKLAIQFQRKLPELDEDELQKIYCILDEEEK